MNKGKELERACDFAMALKYYFAGRMYFAAKKLRQASALPLVHDAARTPSATPKKGAPYHNPGSVYGVAGGGQVSPAPASALAPFDATASLGPFRASPASALSADLGAKHQKLSDDFDQLYRDLLPMTNAEVKHTLLSIYCTYLCVVHFFCFSVISCRRPMPVRVSASTIKTWCSGEVL